jgi:hypothetical protein
MERGLVHVRNTDAHCLRSFNGQAARSLGRERSDPCDWMPSLRSDRREGRCLLSYNTSGGWVAITKDILTAVLGAGRDAKIVGLPPASVGVLTLMCPSLVVLPEIA